jgi:hypothetical protein
MSIGTSNEVEQEINHELLRKLHQVVLAIEEFKNHYDKKLNVSKLVKFLKLDGINIDELIHLILTFQRQFNEVFKDHILCKKILNGQIYLVPQKKLHNYKEKILVVPETVILEHSESKVLSDVIYLFKHVRRGKGFDLKAHASELVNNIILLKQNHPYFFIKNGNDLVYPSQIALELGTKIHTYHKSNKQVKTLTLHNCNFIFGKNVS